METYTPGNSEVDHFPKIGAWGERNKVPAIEIGIFRCHMNVDDIGVVVKVGL